MREHKMRVQNLRTKCNPELKTDRLALGENGARKEKASDSNFFWGKICLILFSTFSDKIVLEDSFDSGQEYFYRSRGTFYPFFLYFFLSRLSTMEKSTIFEVGHEMMAF